MAKDNKQNLVDEEGPSLNKNFSFVDMEHDILKFWNEEKIFEKSLEKTISNAPYIFYDGPPFATGLPHHGHLVASTLKDIVPRYFTMKGRYVSRRFGWDCHGLPIEQEIDKKFGMSAHEYVKKHGVKSYNDECRKIVLRFTQEWEKTISRLGRWVDFKNDYKTMDLSFMESIWWVFKRLWDLDLVYKGTKVVPFSTAFGTVLSNFEATSNYQDVQDPSLTLLFESNEKEEGEKVYFAAWTTTPWTLPSNLGLCVNSGIEYSLIRDKDKNILFYMAKERAPFYSKKRNYEELKVIKGSQLVGRTYQPLFNYFSELKAEGAFTIYGDDYVSTTDGTGIVHMAPAFGEDDHRVMVGAGIKTLVCPIDEAGKFTSEVSDFVGQYIKDADKLIIKKLKDEGKLYEQSTLVHSYPFCPRTDTPLIYRIIESWYINVDKIKDDLIKSNKEINWVPEHIKEGRFGKWLEGARDWSISRNRVWGTPIPIWFNEENGKHICIGSLEELEEYTGKRPDDIHRENVDGLVFEIDGEKGSYKRIPEVLDCWFESGSMPYSQLHYPFENKELFEKGFPAEYIAEGLDQTRGWFYTLTVLATALFKRPAFKNVIVNGMVLAKDGKKMSKRLKNYTQPDILMEMFGADALRLFLINSGLVRGEELRFTDEGVKDMVRRALLPWYNSFKFFQTYAEIDGWTPEKDLVRGDNILDKWILSRLQTLIEKVTAEMDSYRLYNVVPALFSFIEDLTNWYIRLNRRRFWGDGLTQDKKEAYSTLYTTIRDISILMAPFAPFLAEFIYLELKKAGGMKEDSVHLRNFPISDKSYIDSSLEEAQNLMAEIVLMGRQIRNNYQIKVKTPLRDLTIIHKNEETFSSLKKLEDFIKGELNIKEIHYSTDESKIIKLYAKPNSPVLGKRLGKRFGEFRTFIESLGPKELQKAENGESIHHQGEEFKESDLLIFRESISGENNISSSRLITIKLNTNLDDDLIDEGLAREVVNRIQKTRKDLDFHVADRIEINVSGDKKLIEVMKKYQDYIGKETLTESFTFSDKEVKGDDFEIEKMKLSIAMKRL